MHLATDASLARPHRIEGDAWRDEPRYWRGVALFNAGYYWEAHEVWEALWHAQGRQGWTADLLKALIKLAAAGVKVRQGQAHGVRTHARRAREIFETLIAAGHRRWLGLDLSEMSARAREVEENPPEDPAPVGTKVVRVFRFQVEPRN